jgi:hypothetical protein
LIKALQKRVCVYFFEHQVCRQTFREFFCKTRLTNTNRSFDDDKARIRTAGIESAN